MEHSLVKITWKSSIIQKEFMKHSSDVTAFITYSKSEEQQITASNLMLGSGVHYLWLSPPLYLCSNLENNLSFSQTSGDHWLSVSANHPFKCPLSFKKKVTVLYMYLQLHRWQYWIGSVTVQNSLFVACIYIVPILICLNVNIFNCLCV